MTDPWIQTFCGKKFHPLSPRPQDIEIEDIAHALAMKCRFTGHTKYHYSIGQHSLFVVEEVIRSHRDCSDYRDDATKASELMNASLWALLHDAAEAYLPDVARPIKHSIWFQRDGMKPEWMPFGAMELRILHTIGERFGLTFPIPDEVHAADLRVLATEYRDLMHHPPPAEWEHIRGVEPYPFTIRKREIACVKEEFLRRFFELTGKTT